MFIFEVATATKSKSPAEENTLLPFQRAIADLNIRSNEANGVKALSTLCTQNYDLKGNKLNIAKYAELKATGQWDTMIQSLGDVAQKGNQDALKLLGKIASTNDYIKTMTGTKFVSRFINDKAQADGNMELINLATAVEKRDYERGISLKKLK